MDMNQLMAAQITALERMRKQSDHNFSVRDIGQKTMYFMMSLTPFLLPGLNRRRVGLASCNHAVGARKSSPNIRLTNTSYEP